MVRRNMVVALFACVLMCGGCSKDSADPSKPVIKPTPEQIAKMCNGAGQVSALTWIAVSKPTPADVKDVKFVIDEITKAMVGYTGEGFIGMLPSIDVAIAKAFPGTDERSKALKRLAHLLASNGLVALDNLFAAHPDWEVKGDQAAIYVSAFTTGASDVLSDFAAGKIKIKSAENL